MWEFFMKPGGVAHAPALPNISTADFLPDVPVPKLMGSETHPKSCEVLTLR